MCVGISLNIQMGVGVRGSGILSQDCTESKCWRRHVTLLSVLFCCSARVGGEGRWEDRGGGAGDCAGPPRILPLLSLALAQS